MSPTDAPVSLSDLQIAVMRVLWQRGEASTADVAAALADERGLAHTTVATLLSRLEKRRLVGSRRDGRQLVYRARISETQVRRSMVSGLLASLFGGDARALVSHLVDADQIEPAQLDELRRLLARGGRKS
jgi:predicted transcriptional regulator